MKKNSHGFMLTKDLLLTGLCAGLLTSLCSCNKLMIASEGTTQYTIVQSDEATVPEKYAVQELTNFLNRVTGASFPVVAESSLSGKTRGIYVGWTEYASRNGIEASKLGEEEWIIRSVGKNLILTGGRPRGTMYAVYEFLERQVGCHWLDRNTEIIPSMPTLKLGKLDIRGKPWFWIRDVHSPLGCQDDKWKFMIRNKNYRYGFRGRTNFFPEGAFYRLTGSPRKMHTFSCFVNASNWFETHPEYFSLVNGKHVPAYNDPGPGQLCLTHPDVRRLTLEKLREFIKKDRKEAKEKGCPPPKIYYINQNDNAYNYCRCTNCQIVAKREGSQSGPLIEYINAVAEEIEKDYPDILIGTIAYIPPKNIKSRNNVLVSWVDIYSTCDGIRPLKHPYNFNNYQEITGWGKVAARMAIGDDYWTSLSYYPQFPTPYSIIDCVASDLKLFADQGCESFFAESADYSQAGQQFIPLKFWLAYQLLVDPHQPVEPLIKTFMDGYYGAASGKIREYLKYLRKRINKDAQFKALRDEPHKLKYLDLDFFVTSEKLFDEAEALVKPDSLEAKHIQDERFILDGGLLFIWPWLDRKLSSTEKMPFNHEEVIKRYEKEWHSFVKGRYSIFYSHREKRTLNKDGKLMEKMAALFRDPKLPEQFRNLPSRDVADFNWLTFSKFRPSRLKFVPDDDAGGGMTATFTTKSRIQKAEKDCDKAEVSQEEQHRKPLTLGVTGGATITLKPEEIPQDGKYHLYRIGRVNVKKGTTVWALEGKRLGVNVDRLFVTNASNRAVNDWNAYISLKVQGPAYVKGSKKPNGVWMDRVLLVKPQPGEKVDPAELQRLEEKKKFDKKRDARRPHVSVPRWPANAGGDPQKIDWEKSVNAGKWSTRKGAPTARKVEARLAQDGKYLYIRLTEEVNTKTLINDQGIFSGDDWELFFAAKRGEQPYRQIAINPKGEHKELAYGENSSKWESGVKVMSETGDNLWKVSLGFPLDKLLPGGVKPGQTVYANIFRGGKDLLAWSPTFEGNFHSLDRMGEIVLE